MSQLFIVLVINLGQTTVSTNRKISVCNTDTKYLLKVIIPTNLSQLYRPHVSVRRWKFMNKILIP